MTLLTVDQFLAKYQNKSNDFDGMYQAQCFDLFQFYNRDVVGAPTAPGMPNGTPEAELIINALSNRLKSDSKIKEAQAIPQALPRTAF